MLQEDVPSPSTLLFKGLRAQMGPCSTPHPTASSERSREARSGLPVTHTVLPLSQPLMGTSHQFPHAGFRNPQGLSTKCWWCHHKQQHQGWPGRSSGTTSVFTAHPREEDSGQAKPFVTIFSSSSPLTSSAGVPFSSSRYFLTTTSGSVGVAAQRGERRQQKSDTTRHGQGEPQEGGKKQVTGQDAKEKGAG